MQISWEAICILSELQKQKMYVIPRDVDRLD